MEEISRRYLGSLLGERRDPSLEEIAIYRQALQELLGLDCNLSYGRLVEGLYPIDLDTYAAQATLSRLTDEALPDDLTELVIKQPDELLLVPDFELYVLGENSD